VPVYGRAYPEEAAYPEGIPPQAVTPLQCVRDAQRPERAFQGISHVPNAPFKAWEPSRR
jgi:hypothetical protein